jgi:hypothetical protein
VRTFALWTVVLVGTLAMAQQHCRKVDRDPSTGFCVVPDHKLTPGLMDASLVCQSNQDRPRHVTSAEKKAILKAYGYPPDTDMSTGEFDHWLQHWMGGSDKQANIWFEPHAGTYGSLAKDKVELLHFLSDDRSKERTPPCFGPMLICEDDVDRCWPPRYIRCLLTAGNGCFCGGANSRTR